MTPNEALTRKNRIDPALLKAGWNVHDPNQVGIEIPVDGYNAEPWNGITDYILHRLNGEILAVVEAKKQTRDPNVAREQVKHYVTEIGKNQSFVPFAFMTNGLEIFYWEGESSNPRPVSGFFTLTDLENLLLQRLQGVDPATLLVDPLIAGRVYQQEAIRRVTEAFAAGKRRALVVMATGTGKTRTITALIKLMMQANQARHVLFIADRDTLVDQALKDALQVYLPNEPSVRIYTHTLPSTQRLYVATLQTLSLCYQNYSPGFFDLIIFDEAHRSLFNRFNEVMEYFDARMIGLTATPATFLDRDTFRVFHCDHQTPTALYTYKEAVDANYLVDFVLYQAKTGFQRDGIKGAELSEEEKNLLIEDGIEPEEINYEGTEIERTVSNTDTLRKQWQEFMEVCHKDESGTYPAKTIVFALSQAHAERLRQTFEATFPQYVNMVQVITSDTERVRDSKNSYGDGLITKFKKEDFPRIAISVDMLDTGVDIPEVCNLVFMKPVNSQIKLWQMIGRGTRNHEACKAYDRLPNGHKSGFLILDFWQNEFNKQAEAQPPATLPILVSLFNTRMRILEHFVNQQGDPTAQGAKADLRAMITRIPKDSFTIRQVLPDVELVETDTFWMHVSPSSMDFLKTKISPLLRYAAGVDVSAETFRHKCERLKLALLKSKTDEATVLSIADDVGRLPAPDGTTDTARYNTLRDASLSGGIATATPQTLSEIAETFAPLMKNRREKPSSFRTLDLADIIAVSGYITLSEGGERIHVAQYRERVEKRVLEIVDHHPTILAIQEGKEVTELDLIAIERTLSQELGGDHLEITTDNIRRAYNLPVKGMLGLLRHLLAVEVLPEYPALVERLFEKHFQHRDPPYNADQLKFLRAMQTVLIRKRRLNLNDLYDDGAFSAFGNDAVDRLFTPQERDDALAFVQTLAIN